MWRVIPILLASFALACAVEESTATSPQPLLRDAGAPPSLRGSWVLVDALTLSLQDGRLSMADGQDAWLLADRVIGAPVVNDAGDRLAYCRQGEGVELASIEVWELSAGARRGPRFLTDGDRPALSPDGELVAFVSGRTGIASVFVVPFAGGDALQLTNVGIERPGAPGQAPVGFVPPPHEAPPRFDDDQLVWDSPRGSHAVELP